VKLTIKSERGENGELLMSITDSGVGLPAEKAHQIFDAFFTTKRRAPAWPDHQPLDHPITRRSVVAGANAKQGVTFYFTLPSEPTTSRLTA